MNPPLFLFFTTLVLFAACKKNNTPGNTIKPPTGITIIAGNNQVGYPSRYLKDSIIIEVTAEDAAQLANYSFIASPNNNGRAHWNTSSAGNTATIKVGWELGISSDPHHLKLYVYGCSDPYLDRNCAILDSVTVDASINPQQWIRVFPSGENGYAGKWMDIHFRDAMNGFVIGEGYSTSGYATTSDGGQSWQYKDAVRNDFSDVAFFDKDTGIGIVTNNWAYATYDGGVTFNDIPWTPPIIGDRSSRDYFLITRKTILTVGSAGRIAKTTDAGATWTPYTGFTFINGLNVVTCPTDEICYACGEAGKIIKTTNAGDSWNEIDIQFNNHLRSSFFLNENTGFLGGQQGGLIKTENGGDSWQVLNTQLKFDIITIYFSNADVGYVVTTTGEIAKTTDGGDTWSVVVEDHYPVYELNKVIIKDGKAIGMQLSSIFTYPLP